MEDILRNPVELLDEDLDVVAGGNGLGLGIDVNVNVAAIDQFILQIQVGGVANSEAAANVASVSQSA